MTIINNTYTDHNGELHTRNQWISLYGAAYVIDFPRALNENEILHLVGIQSEKVFEGFVKFKDSAEVGIDLSEFTDSDIILDRCNFTVNGKYTLFKSANGAPVNKSIILNEEYLSLIDDEKDLEFFLRDYDDRSPCVIAKNGLSIIAVFMPFKFSPDGESVLADNALAAYRVIRGEV